MKRALAEKHSRNADLATGDRRLVRDGFPARALYSDDSIALDALNERAFVLSYYNRALYVVELGSGDLVVLSK